MTTNRTGPDAIGRRAGGTILVVCSANLMRSPLAAAFLSQHLTGAGRDDIAVRSAGTRADTGTPTVPAVLRVAASHGVDLSAHTATELGKDVVTEADLVLTMTEEQRAAVVRLCPPAVSRTFTLLELRRLTEGTVVTGMNPRQLAETAHRARPVTAPPSAVEDIGDPIGKPVRHLSRVAGQLQAVVGAITPLLSEGQDRQSTGA
jgi:protein-tyrosine phosphatase